MILAGDIGGTKVNLAFYKVREQRLLRGVTQQFASRDHSSLTEILQAFLHTHQLAVEFASFGIAGPVNKGRSQLTNLGWTVDARELAGALNIKYAWLINDLEATAYGIAGLDPDQLFCLNPGDDEASGNSAIIAAGTGLGEAGLFWDGHRHLPLACEGGHSDFAPRSDLDIELFKYLRTRFGKVSWERVLSGPGLHNIYQFLRDTQRGEEPAWLRDAMMADDPSKIISQHALNGASPLCIQTLDLFTTYYGAEASNLALKIMSTGGLYIGGGIAPKIIKKLRDGTFMKAFVMPGRMQHLLEDMPVRIILDDKTALLGAARLAAARAGWIR